VTATDRNQDAFERYGNQALDTLGQWAQINQKVAHQMMDLTANTAKDGLRLLTEVQSASIDAARGGIAYVTERQAAVEEWQQNPAGWYRNSVLGGVEQTQKSFRALEGNAQAFTRYAESLQQTAAEATKRVQEAFDTITERLQSDTVAAGGRASQSSKKA
jgi:hypothetical protein